MQSMKLVSVIIPIYNVEQYIDRCISSIVNQSYKNIEILLINDGSTDRSEIYCCKWKEKDSRISLFNKKNGGLSDARNYGLKHARGEYILFVDSDDWIHKDMISELVKSIIESDTDIACCGFAWVTDKGISNNNWFMESMILESERALDYLIENKVLTSHVCNKLYKASLLWDDIFPVGKLFEDIRIMHKIFLRCNRISIIPGCYYNYYMREDSLSNVIRLRNRLAWVEALQKRYDDVYMKKEYYEELLLSQIAIVYSLSIVQNKFQKEELKCENDKLKEMQLYLKTKKVYMAVKKYATKTQFLYYLAAKFWSYHAYGVCNIIICVKNGLKASL